MWKPPAAFGEMIYRDRASYIETKPKNQALGSLAGRITIRVSRSQKSQGVNVSVDIKELVIPKSKMRRDGDHVFFNEDKTNIGCTSGLQEMRCAEFT
jgi:hypothetical protein